MQTRPSRTGPGGVREKERNPHFWGCVGTCFPQTGNHSDRSAPMTPSGHHYLYGVRCARLRILMSFLGLMGLSAGLGVAAESAVAAPAAPAQPTAGSALK